MARFYFRAVRSGRILKIVRFAGKLLPKQRRISITLPWQRFVILDRTERATYGAEFWRSPAVQWLGRRTDLAALDSDHRGRRGHQRSDIPAAAITPPQVFTDETWAGDAAAQASAGRRRPSVWWRDAIAEALGGNVFTISRVSPFSP
ncbi:MAG: hypothetical protein NT113_25500 [Hyphomicrobiales bacterium]|nr:hypothetical protein [Hyphomicrobiales bacterium]